MSHIADIVAMLTDDPTIASLTDGRVYDHDVRRVGWESRPEAFGPWGDFQPLLMVDDNGVIPEAFGGPASMAGSVYIWGVGPRTPFGRQAVATLMSHAMTVLFRRQVGDGSMLFPAGRLGLGSDEDGGAFDRIEIKVAGVLPVNV